MTTNDKPMTQTERAELRAVVRARGKALKSGIGARKADQRAEIERRINAHFQAQKAVYQEADRQAAEVVREANKRIAAIYAPVVGDHPEWGGFALLKTADPPDLERSLMRKRAEREVEAAAEAAASRLIHWEADALETIARTGIESEQARAILDQMSTIEALMPMVETPAAAEETIDEMVAAEDKVPYYSRSDLRRALDAHAKGWRTQNQTLQIGPQTSYEDLRERGLMS